MCFFAFFFLVFSISSKFAFFLLFFVFFCLGNFFVFSVFFPCFLDFFPGRIIDDEKSLSLAPLSPRDQKFVNFAFLVNNGLGLGLGLVVGGSTRKKNRGVVLGGCCTRMVKRLIYNAIQTFGIGRTAAHFGISTDQFLTCPYPEIP